MAFQSFASERFWQLYKELPVEVQRLADKQYELFREDAFHPSLHLKQVGEVWTTLLPIAKRTNFDLDEVSCGGDAHFTLGTRTTASRAPTASPLAQAIACLTPAIIFCPLTVPAHSAPSVI